MRRENRTSGKKGSNMSLYLTGVLLLVAIAAFVITFIVYSNQLDSELYALDSDYTSRYDNLIEGENTESASSSIGKTVEESKNNTTTNENNVVANTETNANTTSKNNATSTNSKKTTSKTQKDPVFQKPIDGEITKEFAKDNLIYSETLKEWTTHLGVDIKAERASVVKAAADGKVTYIKNDPRFGLTIIIEHTNGYESLYANLLTTEFVSEGEEVKAGQTIGTVGESSIYEIVDESHLHFEILKDSENVNPMDYLK